MPEIDDDDRVRSKGVRNEKFEGWLKMTFIGYKFPRLKGEIRAVFNAIRELDRNDTQRVLETAGVIKELYEQDQL